jgi:hypothetical protein
MDLHVGYAVDLQILEELLANLSGIITFGIDDREETDLGGVY